MNCRAFEQLLEELLDGALDGELLRIAEGHAGECTACGELLALVRLPAEKADGPARADGVAAAVLSRTNGGGCRQAEASLPGLVDGLLAADGDRELLAGHLEHCAACSGLVRELERLVIDLPRLAVIEPPVSLVEAVLRRTLPVPVLMKRWWSRTWPRWVRRPRFASELAYAATLLLVVVFGTPVSPLQAMPERAIQLARTESFEEFGALPSTTGNEIASKIEAVATSGAEHARRLTATARGQIGTILQEVASWFENAEDEPPAESNQDTEETS